MPLPNTIIAGAPKCGTTSLYKYLNDHPETCGSSVKETNYLVDSDSPLMDKQFHYSKNGIKGYETFFSHCINENTKIVFEATPLYIYYKTPIDVFSRFDKIPQIIFMLRNPALRCYSVYNVATNSFPILEQDVSFDDFIQILKSASSDNPINNRMILKNAFEHGKYINYLKPWIKTFGKQNIHIVLFEEFIQNPKKTMQALSQTLQIDDKFYDTYHWAKHNVTYTVKNYFFHKIWKKVGEYEYRLLKNIETRTNSALYPAHQHVLKPIREGLAGMIKKIYLKVNATAEKNKKNNDDQKVIMELFDEYQPSIQELSDYCNIDLSVWKTPG